MKVDLRFYSLLLLLGIGLAWWASLPVEDDGNKRHIAFRIAPEQIGSLHFVDDNIEVLVYKPDGKKRHWIRWQKHPKDADKGVDPFEFVANESMEGILKGFHPFLAERLIGKVAEDKLQDYGLSDPSASLKVTSLDGKNNFSLQLGQTSYGSANRFALNESDGQVLLIDMKDLAALKEAQTRLYERSLLSMDYDAITKARFEFGDKSKILLHESRDDYGQLVWTGDGDQGEQSSSYDSFMDRFQKLRVSAFATSEQETLLSSQNIFLSLELELAGRVVDRLKFVKLPPDQALRKVTDGQEYWVYSDFFDAWANIAADRMESLEKDLSTIL